MSEITSHHLHNVYTLRGARRSATHWHGQRADQRKYRPVWSASGNTVRFSPLAHMGGANQRWNTSVNSAICTSSSTTRPCGWPIRDIPRMRLRSGYNCPTAWPVNSTIATTTGSGAPQRSGCVRQIPGILRRQSINPVCPSPQHHSRPLCRRYGWRGWCAKKWRAKP